MSQFISIYREFNKAVRDNYEKLNLKCLDEVEFESEKAISFHSRITSSNKPLHPFRSYENISELSFISGDIKFYTTLLFLLKNYINNPLNENRTYFQTLEDRRYYSYANFLFQTFYNYWDRIGDLIYIFLRTSLNERDVYFTTVLENIKEDVIHSENFKKLYELLNTKLKSLFSKRKEIVHYVGLGTKDHYSFFENYLNTDEIRKIQNYKENLPSFFKENIDYTFEGFYLSLRLINENGIKK